MELLALLATDPEVPAAVQQAAQPRFVRVPGVGHAAEVPAQEVMRGAPGWFPRAPHEPAEGA